MRTIAEKYIDEDIAQGIQIGEAKGKAKIIKMMLKAGSSIEIISKMTGLSVTEIRSLAS